MNRKPMDINAAILIIDGMNSTPASFAMSLQNYDKEYLCNLHKCFRAGFVLNKLMKGYKADGISCPYPIHSKKEYHERIRDNYSVKWAGDEMVATFYTGDPVLDIGAALLIASDIIYLWFQRPPNQNRLERNQDPLYLLTTA